VVSEPHAIWLEGGVTSSYAKPKAA
jgi:hypothetical protein